MRAEPTRILSADQLIGDTFQPVSGSHVITLAGHAGGSWFVQVKFPVQLGGVDVWIDSNIEFTKNDVLIIGLSSAFEYRVAGGDVGAQAFFGLIEAGGI